MQIKSTRSGTHSAVASLYSSIFAAYNEQYLKQVVAKLAIPRHYEHEADNNRQIAAWLEQEFQRLGLKTLRQGQYQNIVAYQGQQPQQCRFLVGAHFDSVPDCPGADDNASAVAGMLAAAKVLSAQADIPIMYVAFNREEDGLLGSRDFVDNYLQASQHRIELAYILEMIGYCKHTPGSQSLPQGLPIKISDVGDFVAIIANKTSNQHVASIIRSAETHVPGLPVKALKVFMGAEKLFPHLLRSDHSPFWSAQIPAMMWTDTSEFRNPHYHQRSDTPDTLDYGFLKQVTDLLIAHILDIYNNQK